MTNNQEVLTNKQEVLKELLVEAGWISAQHVDKVMLVLGVDTKSETTSVVPVGGRSSSIKPSRDPAVAICMNAIKDWVRANHGYTGKSTSLKRILEEVGIKINTRLARQIVSEAGLEWPNSYNWDRCCFISKGDKGRSMHSLSFPFEVQEDDGGEFHNFLTGRDR